MKGMDISSLSSCFALLHEQFTTLQLHTVIPLSVNLEINLEDLSVANRLFFFIFNL